MSEPQKQCPQCRAVQPLSAAFCAGCGRQFRSTGPQITQQFAAPAAPKPARTDICAILSLGIGVTSLMVFPLLLGAAAFILGFAAVWRISENDLLRGRGMALTGLFVGLASILYGLWDLSGAELPKPDLGERRDISPISRQYAPCWDPPVAEWTEGVPRRHYLTCGKGHKYREVGDDRWELMPPPADR